MLEAKWGREGRQLRPSGPLAWVWSWSKLFDTDCSWKNFSKKLNLGKKSVINFFPTYIVIGSIHGREYGSEELQWLKQAWDYEKQF